VAQDQGAAGAAHALEMDARRTVRRGHVDRHPVS
jgi:hypothetical protein